ncbi:uncharacterized protein ELE39_000983 [Cryptosporidium sp. chipmunk genotype I]|uniref:uncharacterized protein n=1 Tax=Cryptosporidium sp. chipmunk genotype I TaxID=1280935 RepID=UPI00351A7532|nr:hypothetical protein ELE39_000983 [Cryptosporidium sp. chipmunk genotype I]
MDDEVERLRRQAEIRKRRLLERSSDRLRLIYPNYEESANSESMESIENAGYGKSSKSKLIGDDDNSSDGLNSSRVSTSGTFPPFSRDKIAEKIEKQGSSSDLRVVSFVEYWNQGEFETLRKAGSCILGLFLFLIHNFVPDSYSCRFFPAKTRINSVSGIISFFMYQLLIFQLYLYSYFRFLFNSTGSNSSKNKKWCNFIFGCNDTRKVDYFVIMNNVVQYTFAIRNLISEWFLLVTFYLCVDFLHSPFLAN